MIISYFLTVLLIISSLGQNCDDMVCSYINDYVCGMAELKDGTQIITKYQNICLMRKKACELGPFVEIHHVPDELCNIKRKKEKVRLMRIGGGRRVTDYSIVGAHQACNHSCPTFCTDTYVPACAQIWTSYNSFTFRPMVNHCHVDMYSCAAGVNVTLAAMGRCYKNPSILIFMKQMAAMKSLNLIDDHRRDGWSRRRTNVVFPQQELGNNLQENTKLKEQLLEVVRRIFEKYRQGY